MDMFVFKLLLTFLVGSLWITYVTVIAEKLGPKIGGVLAGIPSTTLIALFFIGWTQTAAVAAAATTVLPLALGFSVLFAVIYILLSKVNFYLAIVSGMATWFAASLVIVLAKFDNFPVSLAASIVIISCSFLFVEYVLKIRSRLNVIYTYSFKNLVFRGLLSGSIITSAVFLAKVGGPILGGAFSSFPAVFLSTAVITHRIHGKDFSAAVMKNLMVSGGVNVLVYTVAARYFYLFYGLILGTLFAFLVSLVSAYFVLRFVKKTS
ncbi:DUF3147 family protein [Candidatus Gottesmanbacteria bacterium]|nr:DUF3147 family protein [Candidatus Gottesmanbacteria bacterium]